MTYNVGIVGGTFDRLHEGHKALLHYAFSRSKIVYITVMSDMYTAIHKHDAAPFAARKKAIQDFLQHEGLLERARTLSIDDVYGIAAQKDIPLEALFVTEDSLSGARLVNEKRKELDLPILAIDIFPFVSSETGLPISATHIRSGAFDTKGQLLVKDSVMQHTAYLPEHLRKILQQPFGQLYAAVTKDTFNADKKIIAVGDVTTRVLHEVGVSPAISIIDFVVERKKQRESLEALGFMKKILTYKAENPPGTITPSLWEACKKSLESLQKKDQSLIIVNGEEDLAVLCMLLFAPVGFTVCYGQPHEGMVVVPVTKNTKEKTLDIISSFAQSTTRGH